MKRKGKVFCVNCIHHRNSMNEGLYNEMPYWWTKEDKCLAVIIKKKSYYSEWNKFGNAEKINKNNNCKKFKLKPEPISKKPEYWNGTILEWYHYLRGRR